MIKILHTADIHLDSPLRSLALRDEELRDTVVAASRAAFTRMVDFALSEQVNAVLIAGDLFDGKERSARTGAFLMTELDRLRVAGIKVFYIKGNHDAENPITGMLDLPDNVHVFDARGGKVRLSDEVWVHGVSFAERHAEDSLLPRFKEPVEGAVNIAMLHTSLAGAPGHDIYAPCSVTDLMGMGFDYWALGHIHKRQVHSEEPWIVMPGIPQGRDIGETGSKSVSLLKIENGAIEVVEVSTSVVDFSQTTLDVTEAENDDVLRAMLREHLAERRSEIKAPVGVLRVSLTGRPARHWQFLRDHDVWQEQVSEIARAIGGVWIDKLHFDLSAPEVDEETASATSELASIIGAIRSEPSFAAVAQEEVDTLLQQLPVRLRERLAPDESTRDALSKELAKAGADRLLARMKGTES